MLLFQIYMEKRKWVMTCLKCTIRILDLLYKHRFDLMDQTDDSIISEVNCVINTESGLQRSCWNSTPASAEPSVVPEDECRPGQRKLEDWKHVCGFLICLLQRCLFLLLQMHPDVVHIQHSYAAQPVKNTLEGCSETTAGLRASQNNSCVCKHFTAEKKCLSNSRSELRHWWVSGAFSQLFNQWWWQRGWKVWTLLMTENPSVQRL